MQKRASLMICQRSRRPSHDLTTITSPLSIPAPRLVRGSCSQFLVITRRASSLRDLVTMSSYASYYYWIFCVAHHYVVPDSRHVLRISRLWHSSLTSPSVYYAWHELLHWLFLHSQLSEGLDRTFSYVHSVVWRNYLLIDSFSAEVRSVEFTNTSLSDTSRIPTIDVSFEIRETSRISDYWTEKDLQYSLKISIVFWTPVMSCSRFPRSVVMIFRSSTRITSIFSSDADRVSRSVCNSVISPSKTGLRNRYFKFIRVGPRLHSKIFFLHWSFCQDIIVIRLGTDLWRYLRT